MTNINDEFLGMVCYKKIYVLVHAIPEDVSLLRPRNMSPWATQFTQTGDLELND